MRRLGSALGLVLALAGPAAAGTLTQVISREHPAFNGTTARLTIGRDGLVYLCSGGQQSYVLRMGRDGTERAGALVVPMARNATANGNGTVATANVHYQHKVALYGRDFTPAGGADPFLVSDQVGWDAPGHVEAGAGGDFYAVDQHRDRIVRLSPAGKQVTAYPLPHEPAGAGGLVEEFRVCEKVQAFYLLARSGPIRCVGFDGKERWRFDAGIGWGEFGNAGGFDVDDDGTLYAIGRQGDAVRTVAADGKPGAPVRLQLGDARPTPEEFGFTDLRVHGGDLVLKRLHRTELFQVYDRTTGARRRVVAVAHELLTTSFPGDVWTAGTAVPFDVRLDRGGGPAPRWHVWARPVGSVAYVEFPLRDGRVEVPADAGGVYQIKVTPEVRPWRRGAAPEYELRAFVEVRRPGARGSVSVWTPDNRVAYGRGEAVPFQVLVRAADADRPAEVVLRLARGGRVVAEQTVLRPGTVPLTFRLPEALTARLRPGDYTLTASAPGLTAAAQPLVLGPGLRPTPLALVQYGDYGPLYPSATVWDAPDAAAAQAARTAKLGFNLLVDRLGTQTGALAWSGQDHEVTAAVASRLENDPHSPPPEKVATAPPLLQTLAAYGAAGLRERAILMANDAGLPLGTGFDPRPAGVLTQTITQVTAALRPYPAFGGWSWASNWWIFDRRGADGAATPAEKADYLAALERARQTGAWDPVLERVSDRRLELAVDAQNLFNQTLRAAAPDLVTSVAAPYRNVEAYPPVTLANVDEVDLQAQWEQIALPYHVPHAVDFYRRPGKRAWLHPEVWNDAGTGDQVVPTLFQGLMRGADGIGLSGPVPGWDRLGAGIPDDPRSAYPGMTSVWRSLNGLLRAYGPWLATLHGNDRVAIVVSGRMLRIDDWKNVTGTHFARLLEAYASCLHAHHPATYVFADDLRPDALKRFRAVVVVGQTVEIEPPLAAALRAAREAGVAIFHDGTCRPELVKDFRPLGVRFDHFEQDRHPASDDAAYWRFPAYCRANVPALARALGAVTPPAAGVETDEVFVSERTAEDGRYVFAVNQTTPDLQPGELWRMTLCVATRVPVRVPVRLGGDARVVYDVFAGRRVEAPGGVVAADLRGLPARVFAVLPAAAARVRLQGPEAVRAGQPFAWAVQVQDDQGRPIRASVPVRVRLLDGTGRVLNQEFTAATSQGATGGFTAPLDASADAQVLEATELLSGLSTRLTIKVTPANLPLPLADELPSKRAPARTASEGAQPAATFEAAERAFGPHVRDVVLVGDGSLAVLNAMNWDQNLYAVDTATGQLRWRQRAGDYFAFTPQGLRQGFAVQGFRFASAEGYHLYLGGADGRLERSFALYGLPKRLPHRFIPAMLNDRINHFAVPPDGGWVASAGDLGLAVWARDGRLLWSQDWWKTDRHTATLAALGGDTLLAVEGARATAYDARTGTWRWQVALGGAGEVREIQATADGKTCALLSTADGGRVYVLRDGRPIAAIPTGGNGIALSPDGTHVAAVNANLLKGYGPDGGLEWLLPGDDTLHHPRFAPDGGRVVACSELGTVYVADRQGRVLLERDVGALAGPAWLPDGDLLLATWSGMVCRLDGHYAERWRTHLKPSAEDMRGRLAGHDHVPTSRPPRWGNAEPTPAPLTPNLLDPKSIVIKFQAGQPNIQLVRDPAALVDGKADPPPEPWLDWGDVGWFAETSPANYLVLDTYRTQLRVTGITLVEDPVHPESWLRDAALEYWDPAAERWVGAGPLLSDAAVHTHRFARPFEASRLRLALPWGLCGNLRLAEIVLHGEKLGPSHPDARAGRPVAVLFDEGEDLKDVLPVTVQLGGAYAGGRCLVVGAYRSAWPPFQPPFGHAIPGWDFEIAEHPRPGQYRYLQFAWRALSPLGRGISLQIGSTAYGEQLACYAGEYLAPEGVKLRKVADEPPTEWRTVRVDLWDVFKRPIRVQMMALTSRGSASAFDQIVLGREEKDLPAWRKASGPLRPDGGR